MQGEELEYEAHAVTLSSRYSWCGPPKMGSARTHWRMAAKEACSGNRLVLIRWQRRNLAVPSSQLTPIDADETTAVA
jgi:hypothetical protein